jgi:hypothetical protein
MNSNPSEILPSATQSEIFNSQARPGAIQRMFELVDSQFFSKRL